MFHSCVYTALACVFALASSVRAESIFALMSDNSLITFNSATPGVVSAPTLISGLQANENLLGIDFRPKTGELYGLGSTSRLYKIDTGSGLATAVGGVFSTPLMGTSFGFDVNPFADRIRVHSDLNQNLRLNPVTGAIASVDANLIYAAGDPNFGREPNVVASAYTNNVAAPPSTTLFSLDSQWDVLNQHSGGPGFATMNTVGSVPILTTDRIGFDISGATGVGYASVSPNAVANLYTINLATGSTQLVGGIGSGLNIVDISAAPVPEPATLGLVGSALLLLARLRRKSA